MPRYKVCLAFAELADVALDDFAVAIITGLSDNQALTVDIASALRPGGTNVVSITPLGKPGGSATIVIFR